MIFRIFSFLQKFSRRYESGINLHTITVIDAPLECLSLPKKSICYSRVLCFILSILAFITSCAAGRHPSSHGVQGSYEASSATSISTLKPLIILDAGHGGTDEGAKVNSFMEKRISLTTTLLTK